MVNSCLGLVTANVVEVPGDMVVVASIPHMIGCLNSHGSKRVLKDLLQLEPFNIGGDILDCHAIPGKAEGALHFG